MTGFFVRLNMGFLKEIVALLTYQKFLEFFGIGLKIDNLLFCNQNRGKFQNEGGEMNDNLLWLMNWYAQQCDGDWEHENGIKIGTLDNPGWYIKIMLGGTELEANFLKNA